MYLCTWLNVFTWLNAFNLGQAFCKLCMTSVKIFNSHVRSSCLCSWGNNKKKLCLSQIRLMKCPIISVQVVLYFSEFCHLVSVLSNTSLTWRQITSSCLYWVIYLIEKWGKGSETDGGWTRESLVLELMR